ncbi:VirB4 family type IV secretion/conjugal transfer ATPase [Sphingomonas sp. CGMCC 1.13654]|uniref:Type IV secretion system protein virB4 n=1 Tax=Sphingomonas chungangi TaxID=2683589 RepID=A0A838L251_9SPHN|nr:VirB4 family type IV secretion/conjugal transfer ATPase [Sphingomonas chungangi]MBA2932602.1 VirB4 family type IV secretion/conjugal transfer ATPase [Sphingomonas chungangi]MVW56225.1 VirB4 family type IV secretion/conjugal transfer ATPase [Sphingomonas chungangi]
MQLLPALTADPRVIAREKSAGSHLPYARHVDDVTIETRDGLLLQIIKVDGLLFETADTDELNYRASLRDAMLRTLGSPRFAIYHHVVRRPADISLDGVFPDPFSEELDRRWRARLGARQMFVNELYLTVIRRPLQGRIGFADRLRGLAARSAVDRSAAFATEKRALDTACETIIASLSQYGPRLLSVREADGIVRSEPLEFLGSLYNGAHQEIGLPLGDLGEHLPFRRVSFGQEAFELAAAGPHPRTFGAIVSVKDYPAASFPGMFDQLYRMPFEMTVTQSFAFVERGAALGRMNLTLRRMRAADDEGISLRDGLVQAKDDVASGRAGFGEHHTTIMVQADSLATLDARVAEVTATLADLGIVAVREDIALEPAFWAQFPANFKYVVRRSLVSTANFSGLASLHNFPVGQAQANHWGDAVTLFETTAAGPYFFNFHQADLGNFTVIGPSGSGKTVVLNFLLAQARRFAPRTIFFDKDRGAELFIRAIGGQYDRLRPGAAAGLNPLQLEDRPENRQFLMDWLALLAGGADVAEQDMIREAVEANFQQAPAYRRLRHLVELFRGAARPSAGDLYARLRPWRGSGERAWLFDNEADLTDLDAATIGFDMTEILDDPVVRTPALFYLFHRVEERLDGTPAIIVIDEGWKALDDDVFVRRIKDWEKTIRKRNGIVGFATQSAQDALESRIASAIIEQAATQIFMINPKARAEDYVGGFGLTEHELELVRTLPDNSHCFLVKRGTDSVVVRLNLTGEKDLLTILSGREATVRLYDEIVADQAEEPADWMAQLLERA